MSKMLNYLRTPFVLCGIQNFPIHKHLHLTLLCICAVLSNKRLFGQWEIETLRFFSEVDPIFNKFANDISWLGRLPF